MQKPSTTALRTALVASIRAADEAAMLGAPAESLRHFEQALKLWDGVGEEDVLQHVGREQVVVAQRIDRREERHHREGDARGEHHEPAP